MVKDVFITILKSEVTELMDENKKLRAENKSDFSNEFVQTLLTLLDRIEIEKDHSLASQRHEIAEQHGYTVVLLHPTSGEMN